MPKIGTYCKAYPTEDLRRFKGWQELSSLALQRSKSVTPAFYYLHDNFIVTEGIYIDEKIVFDDVTEEWKTFCKDRLGFNPPESNSP